MVAGNSVDLLAFSEYNFSAPAGTVAGRFTVTITSNKPEVQDRQNAESSLNIYSSSGRVFVLPQGNEWVGVSGRVKIYDITGRLIMTGSEEQFNSGELKEYTPSSAGGILIVELTTGAKRYLEKVLFKGE
jgi:hypothetical protein